jgi:catechol 2,3-dioxygenase
MSLKDSVGLQGHLHHLQLLSPRPEALAKFYGECLGMKVSFSQEQCLCVGPNRAIIIAPGTTRTLGFAAYAAADATVLAALAGRLAKAGVDVKSFSTPLFNPDSIQFFDPDGNCLVFGLPRVAATPVATGLLPARLQHIVLGSTDAARMLAFYRDVVGFRLSDLVVDASGGLRTFFVRSDHEHHSLAVFQADSNRLDHHCYESANWNSIRDWGDHFASIRLPVEWGPGRHGPGNNLFVFVHDPEGNWIEISAELEQVTPDREVGAWPHEERTLNVWGRGVLRS